VKGPGTIGIDSNGSLADVYCTVNEALDYYGIYCITRPSSETSDCIDEDIILSEANGKDNEGCEEVKDIFEDFSHERNQDKHQSPVKDRQSFMIGTVPSIDFLDHKPREPDEVILNRRISMGVYGMFSKFM
jgi:hypothetical protein